MEYLDDSSLEVGFPQRYQYGHDIGAESREYVENAVAVARDGSCVYGVSQVSRADNGDMIATVADTDADDTAPYSFIKYVYTGFHHKTNILCY